MTESMLKDEIRGLATEVQFGKKTTRTYRGQVMAADLKKHELMGSPTWTHQSLEQAVTPAPRPEPQWAGRAEVMLMGPTTGGAYPSGPTVADDPWAVTANDTWAASSWSGW